MHPPTYAVVPECFVGLQDMQKLAGFCMKGLVSTLARKLGNLFSPILSRGTDPTAVAMLVVEEAKQLCDCGSQTGRTTELLHSHHFFLDCNWKPIIA
jgi:hypothetical protein